MKIEMLMEQAQTRTEEMAALASAGIIPPAGLATRMQDRIQQALQLTATLDDAEMTATLASNPNSPANTGSTADSTSGWDLRRV